MATARSLTVNPVVSGIYHCCSRCCRRLTLIESVERLYWIIARLEVLASIFAVDVCEYALMENHVHLILRTHPELAWAWTAEEVAERWLRLRRGEPDPTDEAEIAARGRAIARLASDEPRIDELRRRLADLGWFHKEWKEPCAKLWNQEDEVTGHFWEGRYSAKVALDDVALIHQAIYVLLNHVRCGAERSAGESDLTSMGRRISKLVEEIRAGGHADMPAAFENRFANAEWTPVFPCDPGGVRDRDDATFAACVAQGRHRAAIRTALADEGITLARLATDAPAEEIAPHVCDASAAPVRAAHLPLRHLRPRPQAGTGAGVRPPPRRDERAWLTALENPFARERIGDRGAVPILRDLTLTLSVLVHLTDEEGRHERPDKPCRIDPAAPPAMEAFRARVLGPDASAPACSAAESAASPGVPGAGGDPLAGLTEDVRATAAAVRSLASRHRELLGGLCAPGQTRTPRAGAATGPEDPSAGMPPGLRVRWHGSAYGDAASLRAESARRARHRVIDVRPTRA